MLRCWAELLGVIDEGTLYVKSKHIPRAVNLFLSSVKSLSLFDLSESNLKIQVNEVASLAFINKAKIALLRFLCTRNSVFINQGIGL